MPDLATAARLLALAVASIASIGLSATQAIAAAGFAVQVPAGWWVSHDVNLIRATRDGRALVFEASIQTIALRPRRHLH